MITKEMTPEERLAYCRSVIQAQQESGLSVTRWCRENKVPKARFYRYKRHVEGQAEEKAEEGGVYHVPGLSMGGSEQEIAVEISGIKMVMSEEAAWKTALDLLKALKER